MSGFYIITGIVLLLFLLSLLYIKLIIRVELFISSGNTTLAVKVSIFSKEWQKKYSLQCDFNTISNYLLDALKKSRGKKSREVNPPKENRNTRNYYRLINFGVKYLVIEHLDWRSNIGLNDAMHTAMSTGGLWAIKGTLVGFLSSKSRLQDISFQVEPDFNKEKVVSNLYCILKMRIVHIIFIIFYYLVLIVRGYLNGFTAGKAEPSH